MSYKAILMMGLGLISPWNWLFLFSLCHLSTLSLDCICINQHCWVVYSRVWKIWKEKCHSPPLKKKNPTIMMERQNMNAWKKLKDETQYQAVESSPFQLSPNWCLSPISLHLEPFSSRRHENPLEYLFEIYPFSTWNFQWVSLQKASRST